MNRVDRLTAILLLLQERPRTSEEIARRFEVSKRTVLRDVQALSEMGVPVIARDGAGGGYSLPDDYHTPPLPLSAHEIFLLLLALGSLNALSDAPYAGARASLMAARRFTWICARARVSWLSGCGCSASSLSFRLQPASCSA